MKIVLVILCLLFSISLIQAQNKTINNFYKTHRKGENAMGLRLAGWVVQAGVNLSAGDKESRKQLQPFRPFLRRLNNVRILTVEHQHKLPSQALQTFVTDLEKNNFFSLLSIKEEGTKVNVLANIKERGPKKKKRKVVKNLLLLVQDEGELVVLTINGNWQMRQINNLLKEKKTRELWAMN